MRNVQMIRMEPDFIRIPLEANSFAPTISPASDTAPRSMQPNAPISFYSLLKFFLRSSVERLLKSGGKLR
jgi:hypothetical protein